MKFVYSFLVFIAFCTPFFGKSFKELYQENNTKKLTIEKIDSRQVDVGLKTKIDKLLDIMLNVLKNSKECKQFFEKKPEF